ncbi:Hypothetical protein FKW44_011343, partial [Caligus rogercresseyi]
KAPNSRPSSSLKESHPSRVPSLVFVRGRGIPSLFFDLKLPIPRLRYRISHFRERSYIPRLQEGPLLPSPPPY